MGKTSGRPQGQGLHMASASPSGLDPTAMAIENLRGSAGITRTATAYQQAITVHKPRDMAQVTKDVLYEAEQMGESFVYSWTVKDKNSKTGESTIEGTSIEGAMILFRNFSNCALETDLVDETPTAWIFKSFFIDIEKGITVPRLFRQRKSGGPSGMQAGRAEDAAFSQGVSKSQRNVIVLAMPAWLRDKAIEKSKDTAAKKYENVAEWAPKCIAYFQGLGVPEDKLVRKLMKPKEAWSSRDILTLRIIAKSLADKETTLADEFPDPEQAPEPGPTTVDADGVVNETPTDGQPSASSTGDGVAQSSSAPPDDFATANAQKDTPKTTAPPGVNFDDEAQMLWERVARANGLAELGAAATEVEAFAKNAPEHHTTKLRRHVEQRTGELTKKKGDK